MFIWIELLCSNKRICKCNCANCSKLLTSRRRAALPGFDTTPHSRSAGCAHIYAVGRSKQEQINIDINHFIRVLEAIVYYSMRRWA